MEPKTKRVTKLGGSLSPEVFESLFPGGQTTHDQEALHVGGLRPVHPGDFPPTVTGADGRERLATGYVAEDDRYRSYTATNGKVYSVRAVERDGQTLRTGFGLLTIWHVICELVRQNDQLREELGLPPVPNPMVTVFQGLGGCLNQRAGGMHDDKGQELFPGSNAVEAAGEFDGGARHVVVPPQAAAPKRKGAGSKPKEKPGRVPLTPEARHVLARARARALGIDPDAPSVQKVADQE